MAVAGNITVALLQEAGGTALVAVQGAVEGAHGPANVREAGGKQGHHRKTAEGAELSLIHI